MSQTPRKRDREHEALVDSVDAGEPKRFHHEGTDRFQFHLLQLDKTLSDDAEEDCAPSEELVNGVMKSLEEEIFAATCSTSYNPSYSADNSAAADIPGVHEGQTRHSDLGPVDLCYLLEASDDELGIPPSPALDVKDDVCQSPKVTSDGLSDSSDLKSLAENWHFEDDFDNYQEFGVYEDAWGGNQLQDYMNRDFVSHGMLFDGEFSATGRLETAGGI